MNPKPVKVCNICCAIDCSIHLGHTKEFECSICLTTHLENVDAMRCCAREVSWMPLDQSCFAPQKKGENFRIKH